MLATLPQLLRHNCLHAPPPLARKPHSPLMPRAQSLQLAARIINCALPAVASNRSQHSSCRCTQAYHRAPATSAASSFRDSVPATLPHLLGSHCLHTPPPLGPPLANLTHPLQPPAQSLQLAARIIICALPAVASNRSQRSCRRCKERTPEVQPLKLRHPSETRCQRRCPIISDRIFCMPPPPLGSVLANPTNRYSPARNRHSPQHEQSSTHRRRSQATAHSASWCRCTQRTTEVQRRQLRHPSETRCQRRCPIISDLIVCTAAPRPAPRKPDHPLQSRAQPTQRAARNIINAQPAFASTRSQRSCRRCTQRTTEVQPLQLRHPSETRCQRRCPSCFDLIG